MNIFHIRFLQDQKMLDLYYQLDTTSTDVWSPWLLRYELDKIAKVSHDLKMATIVQKIQV
jgi:hypothetical protein